MHPLRTVHFFLLVNKTANKKLSSLNTDSQTGQAPLP